MRGLYFWGGDDFVSTPGGVNKRGKVGACGGLADRLGLLPVSKLTDPNLYNLFFN